MREEVFVDFVVPKVEDIFDGADHFGDVEGVKFFLFDALDVELVVDLLLDVLSVGLQVDQKALFCLLDLLHKTNKLIQPSSI
jgi:hypothetical protein